jgi:hypothetical protein
MARTIKQIYDEMISEKETMTELQALQPNTSSFQTLLSDLTTNSKVAVWRLIFFVAAVSIWTLEKLFDEHKIWIEERAKQIRAGTTFWYQQKALEFQYGDDLEFNGTEFAYPVVVNADDPKRVVKLASVVEASTLLIKVAKLNGDTPEPLSTPELDAFTLYIKKIKYAGLKVQAVSREPDLLRVEYKVYINPLVLNTNGELLSNPNEKPVEKAITEFIKKLTFDGVFSPTALTDAIQKVDGVVNPIIQLCQVSFKNPTDFKPVGDFYTPNAGYMIIDNTDPQYTLSETIEYLIQ